MATRHDNPESQSLRSESIHELSADRVMGEVLRHYILVGGTALAAAVLAALAWFFLLVPTYESEAYLAVDVEDEANSAGSQIIVIQSPQPSFTPKNRGSLVATIHSPAVLDPVIAKTYPADTLHDEARAQLRRTVSIQAAAGEDRKSPSVFVIRVKHGDRNQAQAIAAAVVEQLVANSVPGAMERKRLQDRIDQAQERHDALSRLIDRLEGETATLVFPNSNAGQLATPLAELTAQRAVYGTEAEQLRDILRGLTTDAILSPPTLPDLSRRPVPLILAIAAGFIAGLLGGIAFVLLLLILPPWLDQKPRMAIDLSPSG